MSWYTTIYPEWGFLKEFDDIERVKAEQKRLEKELKLSWRVISDMAWLTCNSMVDFNAMRWELTNAIDEYTNLQEKNYFMYVCEELLESKANGEKPNISVNHYKWSSNPKDGIEENDKIIDDVVIRLRGLCFSNIRDIIPTGEDEPISYVVSLLDEYKEQIDRAIYDMEFSKICVRFWDTHTEG